MKTKPNKVQIHNENGDKQSQNIHVEVNRIVQNNLHIAET